MLSGQFKIGYIDGRLWRLHQDEYHPLSWIDSKGTIIPDDKYVTDLGSIPRFFWRVLPPAGDGEGKAWGPATIIHDWMYKHALRTKEEADNIFLLAMEQLKVKGRWRYPMYQAVRLFGKGSYK